METYQHYNVRCNNGSHTSTSGTYTNSLVPVDGTQKWLIIRTRLELVAG